MGWRVAFRGGEDRHHTAAPRDGQGDVTPLVAARVQGGHSPAGGKDTGYHRHHQPQHRGLDQVGMNRVVAVQPASAAKNQ
jgi:hypothetical protein